jgi:DNA-binding NtrC family response regulator
MLATTRLARPATVGIYSATARFAFDALERRIQNDAPAVIVARAGIDPVPYLARAHLSGPRKEAPLVVVDGTSSREHDLERWRDERTSPIALADGGLLVLVDGAALPRDIQVLVARTLTERRPPWERATPLDIGAALTSTTAPATLVEGGLLTPELYARFEDAKPIELSGLHERSEDLFSIVADRLAREGLRVRGRPIGIDAAAFARLVEHPFEGEDHELAAIVTRLVLHARGDVVRVADVDAIGLTKPAEDELAAEPDARIRGV